MAQKQKTVRTPDPAVEELASHWALASALMGGTTAMRAAKQTYLPKWPKESDESYATRVAVSVLFPGFSRTVATLAGKPFSKPLTLSEDTPPQIRDEWSTDIDMEGRNIHSFAADCLTQALSAGLGGILVDFPDASEVPTTEAGVRTEAAEAAAGLRPYWIQIHAWQILGWKAARSRGRWDLTQLRLLERVEVDDGEFGKERIEQVRVLEPGKWTVYRKKKQATSPNAEEWEVFKEGVTTVDFVPFAPFYGRRLAYMQGISPLQEVAHLNVAHWQSASDQQNILHVARVPILCAKNVADAVDVVTGQPKPWELTIGASVATRINGADAELKYVETEGRGIEAGAKDLDALEERMRQAGAELLVIDTKLTATQVGTENAVGMCALQRIARDFEDTLALALSFTARWATLGENGGRARLFSDFAAATLQEASANVLLGMNTAGRLSSETLFNEMKRRGIVSSEIEWEEERERIEAEGPPPGPDPSDEGGGANNAGGGAGA